MKYKIFVGISILVITIVLLIVVEVIIIKYNGKTVAVPNIPREPETIGTGQPLNFVVLGDSTAVGQGSEYDDGIARNSARYLAAKGYAVKFYNFGVSGAVVDDILIKQVPMAQKIQPDLILIVVGANDVTHLTKPSIYHSKLLQTIGSLRASQPQIKIIYTGSPDMGSIPRFPQPARYFAGKRTDQLNARLRDFQIENTVVFAPIAEDTGKIFSENPGLFAQDKFHPNGKGYAAWMPTLKRAFDKVVAPSQIIQ